MTEQSYPGMPTTIKVGYKDIKIVIWNGTKTLVTGRYGEFSPAEGEIRITAGLDRFEVANTLIHEMLHAAYFAFALPQNADEEAVVNATANAYCTMIRDNPKLFQWLNEQLA